MRLLFTTLLAPAAVLALAGPASAHAHLLSASPAKDATVAASSAKALILRFNEPVMARFAKLELTGANGAKVALAPPAADPKNHKAVTAGLAAPLAPGRYAVSWRVVSADTHTMQGGYSFTVR